MLSWAAHSLFLPRYLIADLATPAVFAISLELFWGFQPNPNHDLCNSESVNSYRIQVQFYLLDLSYNNEGTHIKMAVNVIILLNSLI